MKWLIRITGFLVFFVGFGVCMTDVGVPPDITFVLALMMGAPLGAWYALNDSTA